MVGKARYGTVTLYGAVFQQTLQAMLPRTPRQNYNSTSPEAGGFWLELFPLHSQLLRKSLLVSFPPGIDMLKSPGWPYLTSGRYKYMRR